jgi:GNAT superfamily N-acetyltransferase
VAHVSAVFVDPERWREGIAAALLDAAELAMREAGYRTARLFTPEGSPAERFYGARGWRATGERDWLEELGLNVVAYTKPLAR